MASSPEQDPARPGSAWPADASNRRPERRRYGAQSAFASGASGPTGGSASGRDNPPGQQAGSYGGYAGSRASGSQSYGYEQPYSQPGSPTSPSSQGFSQSVYDQADAERRTGRTEGEWPPEPSDRAPGAERRQFRRHTDWRGRQDAERAERDTPDTQNPSAGGMPSTEPAHGGHAQHNPFDPDYRQWRDEQMRQLDRDYAQWRQERYEQFSQEFSRWRSQRSKAGNPSVQGPDAAGSLDHASALSPAPPDAASAPSPVAASSDPLNAAPGNDRIGQQDWTRERDPTRAPLDDRKRSDTPGPNSSSNSSSKSSSGHSSGGLLSSLLGGHSDRKQ